MSIYKTAVLILVILALSFFSGCNNPKSKEPSPWGKMELAEKCSNDGKENFRYFVTNNVPEGYIVDDPECHYSSRLNTCLIAIRYEHVGSGGSSFQRNQVIDVYSNKTILYGWFTKDLKKQTETLSEPPNEGVPNYTSAEYFKQKDRLFSE